MVLHMQAPWYSALFDLRHKVYSLRYRAYKNGRWRRLKTDVSPWWISWLGGAAVKFWSKVRPTRDMLAKLRMKARRCRVWFKDLSRSQRSLIDLVITVVEHKVRSLALARILAPIVKSLLKAMGGIQGLIGEIAYKTKTVGVPLAKKLSQIAQTWGNSSAAEWLEDKGFIRYLAVMDKYKPAYA